MKKYLLFLATAALLFSCAKEQTTNTTDDVVPNTPEEVAVNTEGTLVSFNAVMPDFVIPTKASVDGSSFAWELGDEIAIPKAGGGYLTFTNSEGHLGTFSRVLGVGEEIVAGTAYYPASAAPEGGYSTTFSSVAAAKKSFKMTADVALGATELSFTHQSALVHIVFTNVPSIANKLVVNNGTSDVAVIDFTSPTSTMTFDIPLDPSVEKSYKFMLQENANILKRVSQTSTIVAGTYYYSEASVPVGHIIRVQDAVDWGTRELYVWNLANTKENATFLMSNEYPYKFNTTGDHDHYIVLPSQLAWATPANKIGVKFQAAGGSPSTQTDGIYPLRDITFDVPAGLGMKTDYRIYPHGGSYSSPHASAYHIEAQTVSLTVDCSAISFGTPYLHIGFGANETTWNNKADMTFVSANVYRYTFPTSYFGTSGTVVVSNGKGDGDQWQTVDYTADFTSKKSYTIKLGDGGGTGTKATVTQTASADFDHTEIFGAAPGTAFTSPASITGASGTYLSFDSTYYGKTAYVTFSDNGSNAKPVWAITINQDYDYGL